MTAPRSDSVTDTPPSPPAEPTSDRPFGVEPTRGRGVLVLAWVLFALWLAGLIVLAIRYPARG